MSRRSITRNSVHVAMRKLGGARSTQAQRKQKVLSIVNWCFNNNHCINSIKELTGPMVKGYLESLKDTDSRKRKEATPKGCTVATLHNYLASIRKGMQALGVDPDALGITAKLLGLAPKLRRGSKQPITDQIFESAIQAALARGEEGLTIVLKLERYLGLRGLEALMNTKALVDIAQQIRDVLLRGSTMPMIPVFHGTKGGKLRLTMVIERYAAQALAAIEQALSYAELHNGFLVEGKRAGLKFARARYCYLLPRVGLKGEFSAHSLRYRYVCDKILELVEAGYPRNEVLALVSELIGHGVGRGRMITMVYGSSVVHKLPTTNKKRNVIKTLEEVRTIAEQIAVHIGNSVHEHASGQAADGLVSSPFGIVIRSQCIDESWLTC